jgi:hypothetical protein
MLCIEFQELANSSTLRMEGRLVGHYAEDARSFLGLSDVPEKFFVDVSGLTFVDPLGEQVLSWLERIGAKFVADKDYPRNVCERLCLPLARKRVDAVSRAK